MKRALKASSVKGILFCHLYFYLFEEIHAHFFFAQDFIIFGLCDAAEISAVLSKHMFRFLDKRLFYSYEIDFLHSHVD